MCKAPKEKEYNIFQTYLTREPFFFSEGIFIKISQSVEFDGAQFWKIRAFISKEWTSNRGIPGEGNVIISEKKYGGIGNLSLCSSLNKCPLNIYC